MRPFEKHRLDMARLLAELEGFDKYEDSSNGWVRFYRNGVWIDSLRITDIELRIRVHETHPWSKTICPI